MAASYKICKNLLLAHVKEKKMLANGVSPAYIGTSEITNTKGSRDANAKYSATGHDLERVLKFKYRITATILSSNPHPSHNVLDV